MRNIFLDDEAVEDEVETVSESLDIDDSYHLEGDSATHLSHASSPTSDPAQNTYGHLLLGRIGKFMNAEAIDQSVNGSNSQFSSSIPNEDLLAIERDIKKLTSVRSDDEDEDDEDDEEDDGDLADFIVSDTYVESEIADAVLDGEESSLSSTDSSVARPSGRLRRVKRGMGDTKRKLLPPHPRFAFADHIGDPTLERSPSRRKVDCTFCPVCASKQAARTRLSVQKTVAVNVAPSASRTAAKIGLRKAALLPLQVDKRKATILLDLPAPPIPGCKAALPAQPKESSEILDYVELMKVAAFQSLTVSLPDGFGGEFEIIPSEQWRNLESEGDTEYTHIVYVRGSTKRKGRDDYLVLFSSSSQQMPSTMKFGPMTSAVQSRQIKTKITMIPIREVDEVFKVSNLSDHVIANREKMDVIKPRVKENGSKVCTKIDAKKVIQSATKKLRREHIWPYRLGRRLRLLQKITDERNGPLMEVARSAGYAYLHGPSGPLPLSMPPLPNPVFPTREQLQRILRPQKNRKPLGQTND